MSTGHIAFRTLMRSVLLPEVRALGCRGLGDGLFQRSDAKGVLVVEIRDLSVGDELRLRIEMFVSPQIFVELMDTQGVAQERLWGRHAFWSSQLLVPGGSNLGSYAEWILKPDSRDVDVLLHAFGDLWVLASSLLDPAAMAAEVRRLDRASANLGIVRGFAAEALMLCDAGLDEEAVALANSVSADDPALRYTYQLEMAEAARAFILDRVRSRKQST